jgi:hypothetical protein
MKAGTYSDRAAAVNYPFGVTGAAQKPKSKMRELMFSGRYNRSISHLGPDR